MALRASLIAAAAAATLAGTFAVGSANAAQTSGAVNLRTGPGVGYERIVSIPAGAQIDVYSCSANWCQVTWRTWSGYVAARYIASDVRYTTPRYVAPVYGWSIGVTIPLWF